MIHDESESRDAVQLLQAEKARLQQHTGQLLSEGLDEEQLKRALDPFRSFSLQLEEEVQDYERLKRGGTGGAGSGTCSELFNPQRHDDDL